MAYPGVDKDLREDPPNVCYPIGMHRAFPGSLSTLLPLRELFMMAFMDQLTDETNWHQDVFDEEAVSRWRKWATQWNEDKLYTRFLEGKLWNPSHPPHLMDYERNQGEFEPTFPRGSRSGTFRRYPLHQPLVQFMSDEAFDYCIAELKSKAKYFLRTQLIPTIDTDGRTVVKSDGLVSESLHQDLQEAFKKLLLDRRADGDRKWTGHLVDPSICPFIFGRSRFIRDEVVGVSNALDFIGRGETISRPRGGQQMTGLLEWSSSIPSGIWSTESQWLPANLAFQDDGTIKFTSYINNLHPQKYPQIYRAIEKLIDAAIPAWEQCLAICEDGQLRPSGRTRSRFSIPTCRTDDEDDGLWEPIDWEALRAQPELSTNEEDDSMATEGGWDEPESLLGQQDVSSNDENSDDAEASDDAVQHQTDTLVQVKNRCIADARWRKIRDPIIPEPDPFEEFDYEPARKLREKFRETGLQVIVKMVSVELTPYGPEYDLGGWQVEGQMNEHIVATALYLVDSENVGPRKISFRMGTSHDQDYLTSLVGQTEDSSIEHAEGGFIERIYGTQLRIGHESVCLQHYGTVGLYEGRLLAFPNVFQHAPPEYDPDPKHPDFDREFESRCPFIQIDDSKPGHCRFIALSLVDPHVRIISTANVPPQQQEWWPDALRQGRASGSLVSSASPSTGDDELDMSEDPSESEFEKMQGSPSPAEVEVWMTVNWLTGYKLPPELVSMICEHGVVPQALMTRKEARRAYRNTDRERDRLRESMEAAWEFNQYGFLPRSSELLFNHEEQ